MYAYVGNDPLDMKDPTGTAGWKDFWEPYQRPEHTELVASSLAVGIEAAMLSETAGATAPALGASLRGFGRALARSKPIRLTMNRASGSAGTAVSKASKHRSSTSGNNKFAQAGKAWDKAEVVPLDLDPNPKNWDRQVRIEGVGRADWVNRSKRIVVEDKAMRKANIAKGRNQAKRYAEALEKLEGVPYQYFTRMYPGPQ